MRSELTLIKRLASPSAQLIGKCIGREEDRVTISTRCKHQDKTKTKNNAFNRLFEQISKIDLIKSFENVMDRVSNAKSDLYIKRGWFSFFPCAKSDTEKNLHKYFNGEAAERNIIKIK